MFSPWIDFPFECKTIKTSFFCLIYSIFYRGFRCRKTVSFTAFLNYWIRLNLFRKSGNVSFHSLLPFKCAILHRNKKSKNQTISKTMQNIIVVKIKTSMRTICSYGEMKSSKKCLNTNDWKKKKNICTVERKKKRNTPIYFTTNERAEMKLVSIIMDYCLLQLDAFNFNLRVRLHGEVSLPNFSFFKVNP